jgi:hypothetical protein
MLSSQQQQPCVNMYRVDSFMNSRLSKGRTVVHVQISLPNTDYSNLEKEISDSEEDFNPAMVTCSKIALNVQNKTKQIEENPCNNIIQIVLESDEKDKESGIYCVNYRGASVITYSMENIQLLFKITGFGILTRENVIFDKDYINKEEFFNFIGI